MHWHFEDIPFLIHNIPHALHDLMLHEDTETVKKTIAAIPVNRPTSAPPKISIEKTIDPIAQRAAQNIGLLLHDYLNQLPSFDISHAESEKLLEHWRKVLLEQPHRLATAQQGHWHNDNSKTFWQNKIADHHAELGITPDNFIDSWDDWQRASGAGHSTGSINQLSAMKKKQWEETVMRARFHKEVMGRML